MLTRPLAETIVARVAKDPEFLAELLKEAYREGLDDAAEICEERQKHYRKSSTHQDHASGARSCSAHIRKELKKVK